MTIVELIHVSEFSSVSIPSTRAAGSKNAIFFLQTINLQKQKEVETKKKTAREKGKGGSKKKFKGRNAARTRVKKRRGGT